MFSVCLKAWDVNQINLDPGVDCAKENALIHFVTQNSVYTLAVFCNYIWQ